MEPAPPWAREDFAIAFPECSKDFEERLTRIEADIAIIKEHLVTSMRAREREAGLDADHVAGRLGLTPAEGRVAVLVSEGRNVSEVAVVTDCQESTIRYHLKEIFRKLGISRQAQLVRMVLLLRSDDAAETNA